MISSPQPNKATPDSDSKGHNDGTAIITEPFPPQLISNQKTEKDFNKLPLEQDAEKQVRDGEKQTDQGGLRRWWQQLSLRSKATALAIAIGLLPVLTLGTINYLLSSKDIREKATDSQQELTASFGDQIGRFMFERYANIQVLTSLPFLNNPKATAGLSLQQKQQALDRILKASGYYDSIAVIDLSGNVILETGQQSVAKVEYRKIDYFQEAVRTKRPVISHPRKSTTSGKYSVFLAAPIFDANTGAMISVVRTRLPASILNEFMQSKAKESTPSDDASLNGEKYHLLDANGKIFAATEKTQKLGEDAKVAIPVLAQMQAANKVATTEGYDESDPDKQLISYAPVEQIARMPELNWSVLIHQDTAVVFAEQQSLLLSVLLGTGLTALIVGAIAALLARRATRPITTAANAVEKLGQGKLNTRIAVEGQDELATLGSNINRMAGQMQTLLQSQAVEAERAQLTRDITLHIGQSLNSKEILNTAVQEIRFALKTDRVVVYSFNEIWQGTVTAESVADNWPCALESQIDDPCLAQQYVERYRQGRIKATENIHTAGLNKCYLKQLEAFAVKASIIAPIMQGGELLGLLVAHQCDRPRAWEQSEIDLFAQLAIQVGFALDKANLLDQQRTVKEQLQRRALELLMEVDPVSRGDLTIRANVTEDEIGTIADSYNATVESLRKVVTQVQAAAKQVTTTTSSSEASVQDLSAEALRQTEEITVALERLQEMSTSIRAVAANAQQAEAAVQQANQTVLAGDAAMNRTVDGILAIQETVAQTSTKVQRLGESSQKISKVVKLISAFADQTNLLALNAAIEAARAGDEGRGFAVIADEVQSLAQQSALATAEIENLVMDIQTETNSVAAAMATGTLQVATGTLLVDETRQSLNKITAVSAQISALVEAIALATVAQTHASESVTQTMTDVAVIAFSTSNEATLVSASFKELLAVATELQTSAAQFKVS